MLIEIHMLKNFPASNLNRDDTGAPKTAMFGGVMRGRISSQCLKRSWRTSKLLMNEIGAENIGVRTRKLPDLIGRMLEEHDYSKECIDIIKKKIADFGKSNKKGKAQSEESEEDAKKKNAGKEGGKELKTSQIIFYSRADIDELGKLVDSALVNYKTVLIWIKKQKH